MKKALLLIAVMAVMVINSNAFAGGQCPCAVSSAVEQYSMGKKEEVCSKCGAVKGSDACKMACGEKCGGCGAPKGSDACKAACGSHKS
ncbi:MAG: hypothetical protein AB1454_02380 [Candidatus Auribacterota bacterium]